MSAYQEPGKNLELPRHDENSDIAWPERRQQARYNIDTVLTARLSADEAEVMRGYSLDISINGIAGVFVTGWEIGTRVWLEFALPISTGRMQVQAVVRNRSGYRYGFEFINLSGRERSLIQKTCRVLALFE